MTAQGFTQKYTIIQLFEDMQQGYEFSSDDWPLHSTIVDTFAIDWSVVVMVEELSKLLNNHAVAESKAMGDEFFGPQQQTQVVLLEKTRSLEKLHNDVVSLLENGGLLLNDPQFAGSGFLPHATVQKHARLRRGDSVQFKALSIIDMFPSGDPYRRKVLKTINISSN